MNTAELPVKTIDGHARTVRELLDKAKYAIDFYQREYAWQERQVRELIDDLTGKFLDFYESGHSRHEVERYGHYYLGSIVISHKRSQRFIVDGQQRLTTLTLLLVHLHRLQEGREDERVEVHSLIYSEKFGRKSFNLDVPDRTEIMQRLMNGEAGKPNNKSASVQNICARYANIADHLPEEVTGRVLPFFVDWLLENVHLVEIEAYSDEDAYTIFETMNDRGLSLSLPEMLKGYVLANVRHEGDQRTVNASWKQHMQALKELGEEEDVDFFKNWLRACHAQTIRPGQKGAENRDFERIGTEFHRWVRDHKEPLGLADSDSFVRFVSRDLDFYARRAVDIGRAARTLTKEWESIRYNEDRGFTLQTQALLASLSPDDSLEDIQKKIVLVADFLDIWLARRVWNFRTISYSSVKYTLFILSKELRGRSVAGLAEYLLAQLEEQQERFAHEPRFRLHNQNYRQVRHILARLTHWLDTQCGLSSNFEDLVSQGRARPFEVEHIWADQYDRFRDWYAHPSDFETERNRLGGLVLLQRGVNQSLGDARYEEKRDAYVSMSENLLARSLHPLAYQNNPSFRALIERTGLPFRHYDEFGPEAQSERQELYIRLAEWVWNPTRLELDGEKPPIHEPIADPEEEADGIIDRPDRYEARLAFWRRLLAYANEQSDLHSRISASRYNWLGTRRHGQWWNYVVLQDETRVELYIDAPVAADNKRLYDRLYEQRAAIEVDFGDSLSWQRLDDKRASRISFAVSGGWVDDRTWATAVERSVKSMQKLYGALSRRVVAERELRR